MGRTSTLVLAYLLWAALGFVHGLHWLVLWSRSCDLKEQRQQHQQSPRGPTNNTNNSRRIHTRTGTHQHLVERDLDDDGEPDLEDEDVLEQGGHGGVASINAADHQETSHGRGEQRRLLGHCAFYLVCNAAFWIFRQTMLPYHRRCSGGRGMNVSCLFKEQHWYYQFAYVIHIVVMLFVFLHWLLDLFGLPIWNGQLAGHRKVTEAWIYPFVVVATLVIGLLYVFALGPEPL